MTSVAFRHTHLPARAGVLSSVHIRKTHLLMAGNPRRGTRTIKIRKDQSFVYDDESLSLLTNRLELNTFTGEHRQPSSEAVVQVEVPVGPRITGVRGSQIIPVISTSEWLDVLSVSQRLDQVSEEALSIPHTAAVSPSVVQVSAEQTNIRTEIQIGRRSSVGTRQPCRKVSRLRHSSTRLDYLDHSFGSVSQARSDFSGMGTSDNEEQVGGKTSCECDEGNSCELCADENVVFTNTADGAAAVAEPTVDREPTNAQLMALMNRAMEKIDAMNVDIRSSRHDINAMQYRLQSLEASSRPGSVRVQPSQVDTQSSQGEVEFSLGGTDEEVVQAQHNKLKKAKPLKDKKGRIDDEKARGLIVVKDKLRNRGRTDSTSIAEGNGSAASSIFELGHVRKKMSKKQKKVCEQKVSGRIGQVGAVFPAEESSSSGSSSSSSGTDSDSGSRRRRRRKVKSGAKLIKRPVIRTELWPHTLANEEDGEELTSETIGLPKFLSCFSAIMIGCSRKVERVGRASLLNTFSSVYECLPWIEARTFHNLVMIKIEQGRINWKTDFLVLAEKFLDHKVRLSLRSKGAAAGPGSSFNPGRGSAPRGAGSYGYRQGSYNAARGKPTYSPVCKLWNSGTCSFGDRCKYKHVCITCSEAGKPGELHKATSHGNSAR